MIRGFGEWLKENGYARTTQAAYLSVARKFDEFCSSQGLLRDALALEMYKAHVLNNDSRNYTVMQIHATGIRAYLKFRGLDGDARPPQVTHQWMERDDQQWLVIETNTSSR